MSTPINTNNLKSNTIESIGEYIDIVGATQNNLKNLSLRIPTNELIVVTGVSGSGKSSLVFDTLYAEGQRRYVETFSPYARQFLDRMDKPKVERIDGIPPAIAIDQNNPVRTSRSTVGTMTELNDHLKLLFARCANLFCQQCGQAVSRDTPQTIFAAVEALDKSHIQGDEGPRLAITFPVKVPKNFDEGEIKKALEAQGYTRFLDRSTYTKRKSKTDEFVLHVVQDRIRLANAGRDRVMEALEAAIRVGQGRVDLHVLNTDSNSILTQSYSTELHCAQCDIAYADPIGASFSFNSPIGACEQCRGFGRVIGVDYGLVIPDESKTLREGAVKPFQSESYKECQTDMEKHAPKQSIPLDIPYRNLTQAQKDWVIKGEGRSKDGKWYGAQRFFEWLETKAYKMHIRVLLSRYRAYTPCLTCNGARLKHTSLLWRVGSHALAQQTLGPGQRFLPHGVAYGREVLEQQPGLNIHDVMQLPLDSTRVFFEQIKLPQPLDQATELLMSEIRSRMKFLCDVGLGYLTLDRQSRTLSGGEVQRINLTTALGTSLVNTLFVLDEPSIGLHPRDMGRVVGVMHRLRDAGNSLVVVEHDPQVMLAADRLLDIGPGPGERGGEIVFYGIPSEIIHRKSSLTGQYLSGAKRADSGGLNANSNKAPRENDHWLKLRGATEHNLKQVDIDLPLGYFTCVTGVSGSGKSTLVMDVLHAALMKAKGKPTEAPGQFKSLTGAEKIADVVMVDQTPIGKTTRSNPASYVGAFDRIRALFAKSPVAKERGYTAGTFSFNSGTGRCPTCTGSGFEHVEMQFLSDVYLRCPDCDGTRYRNETLEVTIDGATQGKGEQNSTLPENLQPAPNIARNIADILDMTVSQALIFFAGEHDLCNTLKPLAEVGLEYVKLGQPVPTLSGGEAQRLKLAGHLVEARKAIIKNGSLFIFDEPTTGLHFDDIAKLLKAFRRLVQVGHTLLVIEHNLDVVRAADWLIDLGPEAGYAGGEVVAMGTVAQLMNHPSSHTSKALREYEIALSSQGALTVQESRAGYIAKTKNFNKEIVIKNAKEHNLKGIDVTIPRKGFTVITGASGSGKSTIAFDILFGEGQRRYLESLNAYARQFVQPASKPDVDAIYGIPPTVAIEQRTSRGGRKSTVATLTEVYHFLRLLFQKLGTQYCPKCDVAISPQTPEAIVAKIQSDYKFQAIAVLAPLVMARKGVYTDLATWAKNKGVTHLRVDGVFLPTEEWPRLDRYTEHTIELPVGFITVAPEKEKQLVELISAAIQHGKGVAHIARWNGDNRPETATLASVKVMSTTRSCPSCAQSFPELDPRMFSFNSKHGWCDDCTGTGLRMTQKFRVDERESGTEASFIAEAEGGGEFSDEPCPGCLGARLNPVARSVRYNGESIAKMTSRPVRELGNLFTHIKLAGRDAEVARDIVSELQSRLRFLQDVGLGYLGLDRSAPTLSGGEAQRIRLAAQLGSNLRGVCYILDEPTIGLHPRDNAMLLNTLEKLEAKGNTLVVVEHDEDTIRRADHVIDLGPGAGRLGGQVVGTGKADELKNFPLSLTGKFLSHPLQHPLFDRRPFSKTTPTITLLGADLHNLKNLTVQIPMGRLTVVTGVSGSGKSTLVRDVLFENLHALVAAKNTRKSAPSPTGCKQLNLSANAPSIARVLEVDQTPIGKTPRSCPATYIGFWDNIRKMFADTNEARMRGFLAGRFSFNTSGGRCDECEGQGVKTIEMNFLPDVKIPCEVCKGLRFNPETLSVKWKGKSIGDVLNMSIDEAIDFFDAHPSIHRPLTLLRDVGLGYLTLGQPSPTLSGGEAQRIKLVEQLSKVRDDSNALTREAIAKAKGKITGDESMLQKNHTVYILDEPTVGLHMSDVEKLIRTLHRLVEAGSTVVVIEHDLDVMAEADWLIDLGPEGGDDGGTLVAQGTPERLVNDNSYSHTATFLKPFLQQRLRKQ